MVNLNSMQTYTLGMPRYYTANFPIKIVNEKEIYKQIRQRVPISLIFNIGPLEYARLIEMINSILFY